MKMENFENAARLRQNLSRLQQSREHMSKQPVESVSPAGGSRFTVPKPAQSMLTSVYIAAIDDEIRRVEQQLRELGVEV